ncbi:hypothetical protein [Sorangium sp. So ce1097]|uniref:hypothetical protein n=1 Tax=Sorangium sp. So ce1097 TaxID=3133330 RepID=UPI003F5F1420
MITSKMPLRSEDLVNQTALTLPEREMMDAYTWAQTIDQTNTADTDVDVDDGSNANTFIEQTNQANICWNLAIALATYSDYTDAEVEDVYNTCMQDNEVDKDNDQEIEDEDKKKHKKHR